MALTPAQFSKLATQANKKYVNPATGAFRAPAAGSPAQTGATAYQDATNPVDDIMAWLASGSPNYGNVPLPDYDALASSANRQVDEYVNPMLSDNLTAQKALGEQRKLSTDAATNFNAALAGILTGGLEGQAGRDYAFKTFGGSYVGEIATVEGQRMFNDITRSFNDQEWNLLAKYDAIVAQRPDIYEQIYGDLVKGAEDNYDRGIKLEDSSFEYKFKSALALLEQFRHDDKMAGDKASITQRDEASKRSNLTKVITTTINAAKKQGVNLQLKKIGGRTYYFDPATGTMTPTGVDEPAAPEKLPKTWVDPQTGNTFRVNQDGSYTKTGAVPRPPEAADAADQPTFPETQQDAFEYAVELYERKDRPYLTQARNALMAQFGDALIARGFPRKRVLAMVDAAIKAASGGRPWKGVPAGGSSGSGAPSGGAP